MVVLRDNNTKLMGFAAMRHALYIHPSKNTEASMNAQAKCCLHNFYPWIVEVGKSWSNHEWWIHSYELL